MAIVSDGHGGERYFRSDKGAKFVVEIAAQSIRTFVNALSSREASIAKEYGDTPLFEGMPLTQYSEATMSVIAPGKERQGKYIHEALVGLFRSIITQWNIHIIEHALNNPLNEWEREHVEEKYRIAFEGKLKEDEPSFAKTYGCTLIAYVQTPDYWFAFHIGDGKCICFDVEDEQLKITQPIPWDEKCFLNKTTSISDSHALSVRMALTILMEIISTTSTSSYSRCCQTRKRLSVSWKIASRLSVGMAVRMICLWRVCITKAILHALMFFWFNIRLIRLKDSQRMSSASWNLSTPSSSPIVTLAS
jgi:hypothetical protein